MEQPRAKWGSCTSLAARWCVARTMLTSFEPECTTCLMLAMLQAFEPAGKHSGQYSGNEVSLRAVVRIPSPPLEERVRRGGGLYRSCFVAKQGRVQLEERSAGLSAQEVRICV